MRTIVRLWGMILLLLAQGAQAQAKPAKPAKPAKMDKAHGALVLAGLDLERFQPAVAHDGKGEVKVENGVLLIALDTMSTDPTKVKALGLRIKEPLAVGEALYIAFTLDWKGQTNGSYLTAGLVLSPTAGAAWAEEEPAFVKTEMVGVPPGQRARLFVAEGGQGRLSVIESDGWPANRQGRAIKSPRLEVILTAHNITVREDGKVKVKGKPLGILKDSPQVYLTFQMTSHSNYMRREVGFSDVVVRRK